LARSTSYEAPHYTVTITTTTNNNKNNNNKMEILMISSSSGPIAEISLHDEIDEEVNKFVCSNYFHHSPCPKIHNLKKTVKFRGSNNIHS
jgi:hypothetical protein